jgi:hypothetical protein
VTQSPWGNVDHYQRLADQMPGVVWGLEHAFLRFGQKKSLLSDTIEEAARLFAVLLASACLIERYGAFHLLGGSYGALLSQKICIAAATTDVAPRWLFMIDPPPAGPTTRSLHLPSLLIAAQMIRLGREVAGLSTDAEEIKRLLPRSDAEWNRAAMGDVEMNEEQEWLLAVEVVEQLAAIGQLQLRARDVLQTKRRMDVYRNTMHLWRFQDELPAPCYPGHATSIMLVTSTLRRDFFKATYGDHHVDALVFYGDASEASTSCRNSY